MKTIYHENPMMKLLKFFALTCFLMALSFNAKAQYASPSVVCYGDTIYLFCGGLYGCGEVGSNYTWTDASGAWTSNELNPVISPGSPGYHSGQFYLAVQYLPNGVSSGVASTYILNPFYVSGTVTPVSCNGGNNGAIVIVPDGGQPDYISYQWSNGATTMNVAGLAAGTYSVTVTDANYCTATNSFIVSQPAGMTIAKAGGSNVTCFGSSNGSLSISATGGNGFYTYLWSNGGTSAVLNNLVAGIYTVTVTDENMCTGSQDFIVTQPSALLGAGMVSNVTCYGGYNGAALMGAYGGTPPYTYRWSNGSADSTITGLAMGRYYVTITDANGCKNMTWQDITQPSDITITGTPSNFQCEGSGAGQISTTVTGGYGAPLAYLWNNGQTGSTATGLSAGAYSVTVTNGAGCVKIKSFVITPLTFGTVVITNATCYNSNNGAIMLPVSGGVTPYTYQWNNGQNGYNAVNLAAGVYAATVTDAGFCSKAGSWQVTAPTAITIVSKVTNLLCNGSSAGKIDVTVGGGSPGYAYKWNVLGYQGQGTPHISALAAGTYTVTVTDQNTCVKVQNWVITQPAALSCNGFATNVTCYGGSNGTGIITAFGGTPPYMYKWSNGSVNQLITGLAIGRYYVTITDAGSCNNFTWINITQPTDITITGTPMSLTCQGGNTGKITTTVTGGVSGPVSYQWSNGQTSSTAINLAAGAYTVTVTNSSGCTKFRSFIVDENLPITITAVSVLHASCFSSSNGSIQLLVSGGVAPYDYLWNNGQNTNTAVNLTAGIYTVTVTDAGSCPMEGSWQINAPPAVSITAVATNLLCNGSSGGKIDLTVSGGTPPYAYKWNVMAYQGQGTPHVSLLSAGPYTVTVTDQNSCMKIENWQITQPTGLSGNGAVKYVTCFGGNDGAAIISGIGGTPPYSYKWSTGSTSQGVFGLTAGRYFVTISDANTCPNYTFLEVLQPTEFIISGTPVKVTCSGGNDGQITTIVSGGIPGYNYKWNNLQTSPSLINLTAGTYTVTVTDYNLCTKIQTFGVDANPALTITRVGFSNPLCHAGNDGWIEVNSVGGIPPYSYFWNNGQTSPKVTGLTAGTYQVMVTDAGSCMASASFSIFSPAALTFVSTTYKNVQCYDDASGSIDVTVSGGSGAYTYFWYPLPDPAFQGQGTPHLHDLGVGTYTVTITDANYCRLVKSWVITQPTKLSGNGVVTNVTCHGGNNGTATISGAGGTPPYNYRWITGSSAQLITGLTVGLYRVTITDANSCLNYTGQYVSEPTEISIYATTTNVTCYGGSNGSINTTVTGGTPGYTYLWNNGQTNSRATGLIAGSYSVIVTDAGGCTATGSWVINQPAILEGNGIVTNVTCYGGNNGTATISGYGGTSPYVYLWSNGSTSQVITGLLAGNYSVTITDAHACAHITTMVVTQPTDMIITGTPVMVTCHGGNNGLITTTVTGGSSGQKTYRWNNGQTGSTASNLIAGTYTVTVTNAAGCSKIGSWQVTSPSALAIANKISGVLCNGGLTGMIDITVSGGSPAYIYNWNVSASQGQGTAHVTALAAGVYTVTVTDSHSCTKTQSYLVTQPGALSATGVATNVTCYGGNNGTAAVSAAGGTSPYKYKWTTGSTAQLITGLIAGNYYVTITDANSCFTFSGQVITQPSQITVLSTTTMVSCEGGSNGKITTTVTGGSGGMTTYLWSNGQTTPAAINLSAGSYTVTVTNFAGCKAISLPIYVGTSMLLPGAAGVISGATVVSQGQTGVAYSVAPISGATGYFWTLPAGATIASGSNSPNITVDYSASAVSGSISVYGTNPCGNGTPSPNLNVTVNPLIPVSLILQNITLGAGTYCYNATQTITVAGNNSTFIVNSGASVTMIAGQNIIYLAGTKVKSGGYLHGYITSNGQYCTSPLNPIVQNPIKIGDALTSVNEIVTIHGVRVYPNPMSSTFTIELTGYDRSEITMVEIYNMSGVKIFSEKLPVDQKRIFNDVSWHPGIYFIHVTSGETSETIKLIKL